MIFPIFSLSSLLALLALSAKASPLSLQLLSLRDVVAPKIITPNAQTVWPIGTTQTVTWDTSQLPPVSQITNPTGKVILGFNSSDSLNLDFNHPLASGFQITSGSVQIVVPNVTPRTDYLIVLFGDSGNTSPSFAITQISGSGGSSSSSSSHAGSSPTTSAADNAASTSTLITTPIPITGSTITGGSGTSTDSVPASATVSDTASSATATSPASSSGSASASASSSGSAASASSSAGSSTSAAWSVHRTDNSVMSFKTLSMCMVSAIMLVMTS